MANNSAAKNSIGIHISPKEICLAQTRLLGDGRLEAEHLVKIPTGFQAKEGLQRPMSLNNDFFNEKAAWVEVFKTAVRKIGWNTSTAVVTLSPQFAILRYFVMPAVERRFWNKAIPFESKKYIPVSFDEVVYDFGAYLLEGDKKLGVIFGLTQRKSVEFIINILKASNLEMTAVEINPCSAERLFATLDPTEHAAKGYIHFSGATSLMLFSSGGYPVLYREADYDSSGSMSERKRLDVKGAVQFVERYIGAAVYKHLMLSGDGTETWKSIAEQESPMPVEIWEPAKAASLKDNDAAALFSIGASMRGRVQEKLALDISGISTAAGLEKQVRAGVWAITFAFSGLLILLSLLSQVRIMIMDSKLSAINAQLGNVSELEGKSAESITAKIEKLHTDVRTLSTLVSDPDFLAPKLQAIVENIPHELWLTSIHYENPFAASEIQTSGKDMRISGETSLKGESKGRLVENFKKALRNSPEFKIFAPPLGGMEFNLEGETLGQGGVYPAGQAPTLKTTVFTIQCTNGRKN